VQDCLDPEHFPKIEKVGDTVFMIVRCFDHEAPPDAEDLLELTRKVAFFLGKDFLITIHRADQPFLKDARDRVEADQGPHEITVRLMKKAIESYNTYLEKSEQEIEKLERQLLGRSPTSKELIALYELRSRLSVVKRQAWHTLGVVKEFITVYSPAPTPWLTDLRESAEGLWQYCDELMEDVQNLLGLHIALSGHRTNEVMRFLTVVSLFFLPLTFIVGVYGMNFEFMPELGWQWGYAGVWMLMFAVSGFIYWKVKTKGWLSRD
jgi:magnesium transporter